MCFLSTKNYFLALTLFSVTLTAKAEPTVQRNGSLIDIELGNSKKLKWQIKNSSGKVCARGVADSTNARLRFPKTSPLDAFEFEWLDADNHESLGSVRVEADVHRSPMRKLTRSVAIYQLPVRTYFADGEGRDRSGQLKSLSSETFARIAGLEVDYLWLTGIPEPATLQNSDPDVVKGEAGSYYALKDMWDVNPDLGDLRDFQKALDRAHEAGLRVLVDFIPNHTARLHESDVLCKGLDDFGVNDDITQEFSPNNFYYYISGSNFVPPLKGSPFGADGEFDINLKADGIQFESPSRATGNDVFTNTPSRDDWYETAKLNYGFNYSDRSTHYDPIPRTWKRMVRVAKHWASLGVDGFRVDFAHSVPIEFWRYFASELREQYPELFLLAEAYENDERMKLPGFSYEALYHAGFDSIYNSSLYRGLRRQAQGAHRMADANWLQSAAARPWMIQHGMRATHYLENHDELRVASKDFVPGLSEIQDRAKLGFAYTVYAGLLPGNILIHGGQEFGESGAIIGGYAGDNGRTSIFDYVYQPNVLRWLRGEGAEGPLRLSHQYHDFLQLRRREAFGTKHSSDKPSYTDLRAANDYKYEARWIASYLRHAKDSCYLVVTNSDPFSAHKTTIHFTNQDGKDALGSLRAVDPRGVANTFVFEEVLTRKGWRPTDPNSDVQEGISRDMFLKSGGVPSGLFLEEIPPHTTFVFRVRPSK